MVTKVTGRGRLPRARRRHERFTRAHVRFRKNIDARAAWPFDENLLKLSGRFLPSAVHVIDIHCHILPKVDDGPKSWDTSLEMCRMAADDGIEHIVATPHANERFQYNRQNLAKHLEYLQVLVGKTPRLSLGCDFSISSHEICNARAPKEFGAHLLGAAT